MNYNDWKKKLNKDIKFLRASNELMTAELREYELLMLELYGYIPWDVKGIKKLRKAVRKIKRDGRK